MLRQMNADGFLINDASPCYVIAEIGNNHMGNVETCKEMFKAAKEKGANAVKLQKRNNRQLYIRAFYDSPYVSEASFADTYGKHRDFLEFGRPEYETLIAYAREIDITLFATPFDVDSADFLEDLDMPMYKIASGDLTNIPLIKHVAKFGKPMFISTGGGNMESARRAHDAAKALTSDICIMQCTSGYPSVYEELNLRVIERYREAFPETVIGFSSHDAGISSAIAAYMLGSRVLEKHFTLNRTWKGTDQAFSLAPKGLENITRDLSRLYVALGDGEKRRYESEKVPLTKMEKKLVAARDLPAGHILSLEDVAIKSPGDGMPPYLLDEIIGRTLAQGVAEDDAFAPDMLQ